MQQERAELLVYATCPSCHTVAPDMTTAALAAGADWPCLRCGQRWDARRLANVAAYAVWLADRNAHSAT